MNFCYLFQRIKTWANALVLLIGLVWTVSVPVMADDGSNVSVHGAQPQHDTITKPAVGQNAFEASHYIGQLLASLLLILALIMVSAWLLRRYAKLPHGHASQLQVISALSLGSKEKIALLKVGNAQVLVGITANQINHIYTLEEPVEWRDAAENASSIGHFQALLNKALNKRPAKQDG